MDRFAIVGTAPSWALTPWTDTTLTIASLNDAYQLKGFQRADEWYDIHPLHHFWHPPPGQQGIFAHQIPHGYYARPATHHQWLATQTVPVWLHPEYASQVPEAAGWPTAKPFPRAEIEAAFGRYFTSTPAWMLAHAILRGAREIHIYGIHLSTESEYIEQRPNFEFLIGCVLGRGKRSVTVANGLRAYETADGRVVLPEASPILASNFQYAFEPSPRRKLEPLRWELHKATVKRDRAIQALKHARFGLTIVQEPTPDGKAVTARRARVRTVQDELWHYEALVADCAEQIARAGV